VFRGSDPLRGNPVERRLARIANGPDRPESEALSFEERRQIFGTRIVGNRSGVIGSCANAHSKTPGLTGCSSVAERFNNRRSLAASGAEGAKLIDLLGD
jgi:hypothetical protein